MALKRSQVLPKDMDERQWGQFCRQQAALAGSDSVSTSDIEDGAVTLAKMADLVAGHIIGRLSTDGAPQSLTLAQVVAALAALDWAFSGDIGFFGGTAVSQQTAPSTLSLSTVSGTSDDATINANFAAIQTAVNAIKTALDNLSLTA